MLLYHLADEKFDVIQPSISARRHTGEDPRAVGKPVVWFTNDPKMVRRDENGVATKYQHEVEIADDDPDLFMDELFDQFQKRDEVTFGTPFPMRWYFYGHPVKVQHVRTWDPTSEAYV